MHMADDTPALETRRVAQDAGDIIKSCIVAAIDGVETIMASAKLAPGIASVPPDQRTALKSRVTYCACLVISLFGGLGSDIAEDLNESFRAVLTELHAIATDAPSDVDGDTPRSRVEAVDSKLQMLCSAVPDGCDVEEVLEDAPDLAATVTQLVRAVLNRLIALDFPCDHAQLLEIVREERSKMNAAPRSSIVPLTTARGTSGIAPTAASLAAAAAAAAAAAVGSEREGRTARTPRASMDAVAPAAVAVRVGTAPSAPALDAPVFSPNDAVGVISTPRSEKATGAGPAAAGTAAAAAASSVSSMPDRRAAARAPRPSIAVAAQGGAGGLLHQRHLTAVAILTGIQQLADVKTSPPRIIHAAQIICNELIRAEATACVESSTTADDVIKALHSSRGLDAAAGCLFRHWREPLVVLWVSKLVVLVMQRAEKRVAEQTTAPTHYKSWCKTKGESAQVAPDPDAARGSENPPVVTPQAAAAALLLRTELEKARNKAEWDLRASFEFANGTLQLFLAFKEHAAMPEICAEAIAALSHIFPLAETEEFCRYNDCAGKVIGLWRQHAEDAGVTHSVCLLLRTVYGGMIHDVETGRTFEATRSRTQFLAAGVVPATVAALRAHERGGSADTLASLAGVLELVVRAYATQWLKAGGLPAVLAVLRARISEGPVALALCRVLLAVAQSSWFVYGRRRRLRDAGLAVAMHEVVAVTTAAEGQQAKGTAESHAELREVAASVLFELAGGC